MFRCLGLNQRPFSRVVWHKFRGGLLAFSCCVAPGSAYAAFTQCPAIGSAGSCNVLITINPNGSLTSQVDSSVPPYDGNDDQLVGVVNNSGATVYGIALSGPGIFGFDGDGICTFPGGPACGATGYEGPETSFSITDTNGGVVNFTSGLKSGASLYFSLEGAPQSTKLATTITIDPGHGTISCPQGRTGATGPTNFPSSNPPPGHIYEYKLAFSIANALQGILQGQGYVVQMTKTQVNACPSYSERTQIANDAHSNLFISIHLDGNTNSAYNGSSALYNPQKSSSQQFASFVVTQVSSNLGRTNHGTMARPDLAVLKPTGSYMTSVLAEVATISNLNDEAYMHNPASVTAAASAIAAGIQAFVQQ